MLTSIDDAAIRRVLVRYLANEGIDRDTSHEIYHEDAVLEFPQSGERFVGRRTIQDWRERYPSKTRFNLRRITGSGESWSVELLISYDGGPWMFGVGVSSSAATGSPARRSTSWMADAGRVAGAVGNAVRSVRVDPGGRVARERPLRARG
jgi:hypothetical protein